MKMLTRSILARAPPKSTCGQIEQAVERSHDLLRDIRFHAPSQEQYAVKVGIMAAQLTVGASIISRRNSPRTARHVVRISYKLISKTPLRMVRPVMYSYTTDRPVAILALSASCI